MKTLYLVRHGHVDNPKDVFYDGEFPLSDTGAKQMLAIAEDMKRDHITPQRIVASPYLRTRESAQVLSSVLGPEVEYDDRLVEWQVGDWFGKPLAAFRAHVGYDKKPFRPNTEGVEDFASMAERVIGVMYATLESLAEGESAIIVSHREPSVSAILRLQDKPDWTEIPLLALPRGAAWKLDFGPDGTLASAQKAYDYSSLSDPTTLH